MSIRNWLLLAEVDFEMRREKIRLWSFPYALNGIISLITPITHILRRGLGSGSYLIAF